MLRGKLRGCHDVTRQLRSQFATSDARGSPRLETNTALPLRILMILTIPGFDGSDWNSWQKTMIAAVVSSEPRSFDAEAGASGERYRGTAGCSRRVARFEGRGTGSILQAPNGVVYRIAIAITFDMRTPCPVGSAQCVGIRLWLEARSYTCKDNHIQVDCVPM